MSLFYKMQIKIKIDGSRHRDHDTLEAIMSYIPAITLVWVGPNWSRTLFIPVSVTMPMFKNGVHIPNDSDTDLENRFKTLGQLTTFFESGLPDPVNILDETFDEIGKLPGCTEEYVEFEKGQTTLANIPPGLAIIQWHIRPV